MIDIERFSETARFAREAVVSGAHFKPPKASWLNQSGWERKVDITLTYLFGQEEGKENNRHLSLEDVGKIFPRENGRPLTHEGVRQIVKETVFDFYQNSSQELRGQYSWERLSKQIGKPYFLTLAEGTTRKILEDVDRGADFKFLSKKYTSSNLPHPRKTLGKYGIAVPFYDRGYAISTEELETVGPDTDSDTLKNLLGKVSHSFRQHHSDVFNLHFISLSQLLRKIGFHFRNDNGIFLDKLGESGIEVGHIVQQVHNGPQKGKHNHYFVFRLQEESIRKILLSDPDLANFLENPVCQIAGVSLSQLPNTTRLMNGENYRSFLNLCWELKISVGGPSSLGIDQLLVGCEVPVFEYKYCRNGKSYRHRYYPSGAEDILKRFLLGKAMI